MPSLDSTPDMKTLTGQILSVPTATLKMAGKKDLQFNMDYGRLHFLKVLNLNN